MEWKCVFPPQAQGNCFHSFVAGFVDVRAFAPCMGSQLGFEIILAKSLASTTDWRGCRENKCAFLAVFLIVS